MGTAVDAAFGAVAGCGVEHGGGRSEGRGWSKGKKVVV